MGRVIERVEYDALPTGSYKVVLTGIEEKVGQFGEQFRLSLEVLEGEYEGRRLTAWCSPVLSPKSKLTRWTSALMGDELPEGPLDLDWLINRTAVADVLEVEGKDGATFSKVMEIRPVRRPARPAPVTPSPAPRPAPAAARPAPAPARPAPAKASAPPPAENEAEYPF